MMKKAMNEAWKILKQERRFDRGKGNAPFVLPNENIPCPKCGVPYYHYLGLCEECGHLDRNIMSSAGTGE